MFNSLFSKADKKKVFLTDWQVRLNGDKQCDNFIATYNATEEVFKNNDVGLELIFENGILSKAYRHEFGEKKERKLDSDEIGLPLPGYVPNTLWQLIEAAEGSHQVGGEIPHDFQLPENNCITSFQYLGYINNIDPTFNWLPFKVHLTCPIFLNIENIFIDYSNSVKPVIINREEVEKYSCSFDDVLNNDSLFVYNEKKFKAVTANEFGYEIGNAGIPPIIQPTVIPVCPMSGNRMRFLCQLFGERVSIRKTNVNSSHEYYERYFDKMNFWGDGYLFVFFEPTTKIACYIIQNT